MVLETGADGAPPWIDRKKERIGFTPSAVLL